MKRNFINSALRALVSPGGIAIFAAVTLGTMGGLRAPAPELPRVALPVQPVRVATKPAAPAMHVSAMTPKKAARVAKKRAPKARKVSLNRNWSKTRHMAQRSVRSRELFYRSELIEQELRTELEVDDSLALNGWQPEAQLADQGLEEDSLDSADYTDRNISAAQVDVELAIGTTYPIEHPVAEIVGIYQREDFQTLRQTFETLKDEQYTQWRSPKETEPQLVRASVAPVKSKSVSRRTNKPALAKATAAPQVAAVPVAPPVLSTEYEAVDGVAERSSESGDLLGSAKAVVGNVVSEVGRSLARSATTAATAVIVASALPSSAPSSALPSSALSRISSGQPVSSLDGRPYEDDLMGRMEMSPALDKWLTENKGHVELYLLPVGTRDPQGIHYLTFEYPQYDFAKKADSLKGRYQLVAGIFTPQSVDGPIAEIFYPEEIAPDTARSHLKFFLDTKDLKGTHFAANAGRRHANVSLTFFEGASPEHTTPEKIRNAEVRVIGFPEYGTLKSDADGNLLVSALPNHSQIVFEVRAKDFLRTYRTVPIFGADVHQPIYMVSKPRVKEIVRTLLGKKQSGVLSVVMGRVFDPKTRNPLKNEVVELVDHSEELGSYFSFFGEKLTTSVTGFLSFYNVAPAFRYLKRSSEEARTFRFPVRSAAGYYLELGRGGVKALKGKVTDPNLGPVAAASVRLVGDSNFETQTDEQGRFEIPGIDFPSGVVAVEIAAPHYPTSWHTLPWDIRYAGFEKELFVLQDRFIDQSLAASQSANVGPNPLKAERSEQTGNLIAGAYGSLFEQTSECLTAELWSLESGRIVNPGHGPFGFLQDASGDELCLTKEKPGVTYFNLPPSEYLLKWKDSSGTALGARILHIGMGRDSISVN